jgi:hypothetical protein
MDTMLISRTYLESLSTADLISLADEYGIDIPEELNRRFIIGELLEVIEDSNTEKKDTLQESDTLPEGNELPLSYNETCITVILRNPAWIYVYWDISNADLERIHTSVSNFNLTLKLCFFSRDSEEKPTEIFDITVNQKDRDQYILLPRTDYSLRVDLVIEEKNQQQSILARSKTINLPQNLPQINTETLEQEITPIMELSGYKELLKKHYLNHRESFN